MVESCERGEAADEAGLRPADVVVAWRQGDASGDVESVLRLAIVEQELAPYAPVELEVWRAGEALRLAVPTGRWRAHLRPVLDEQAQDLHERARAATAQGEVDAAGELWRSLASQSAERGRPQDAAFFHIELASALAGAGRWNEAVELLDSGAAAFPDPIIRAAFWERSGTALLAGARNREAGHAFGAAVELLGEHHPDSPMMAFALLQLCRADLRSCGTETSRALGIYRAAKSRTIEVADALVVAGVAHYYRSELEAAEDSYRLALDVVREIAPGAPLECNVLGNLGLVALRRGDLESARELFQQDMALAERLGPGTRQYSHAANYLGLLAKATGRYEIAGSYYEQALASFRASNPDGLEVAGVLNNLGNLATRERRFRAARRYHEEALDLRRRLDPRRADVAASLHNLGVVARRMGDFEKARSLLEQALELKLETSPGTGWMASTIFELGQLANTQGLADEAERRHRRALEIRRRVSPRHPEIAESLIGLGNVGLIRGDLAEAERLWREAIAIIESRRRRLQLSPEAQSRFGAMYDSVHGSLARLLVDTGRAGEAWETLEEARAAHLRSIIAHRESAPASTPSELWFAKTRAETLMARIESRLARIDPTRDEAIALRYRRQLASVEEELDGIGQRIREAAPRLADLGAPQAVSLSRLRKLLHPGTVVIAYDVGDATTMALVTGAEVDGGAAVRWFQDLVGERELRGRVERFNALIERGRTIGVVEPALLAQATRLSELLLEPVADLIASAQRVLIVPDGPLHELPFAALVLPGGEGVFLGHAKPLFVNPSASLAVELGAGSADRDGHPKTIAAFGDPEYSPDAPLVREHHLDPLPGSRSEIEAIRRLFGGRARVFLGGAATEDNFKAHGGGSSVLHCAVHARVDPRVSMDSTLYFSTPVDPDRSTEDGALSAWEIAESLELEAQLVVLSACSTARGRIVPGEGIVGLARAFQVAGARTTVVSQWAVPDRSTAELMVAFYEQLADGRSAVEALQRAQRIIGANPELAHPFHWASFQVTGDWR